LRLKESREGFKPTMIYQRNEYREHKENIRLQGSGLNVKLRVEREAGQESEIEGWK
jgi:hypothetical protein